MWVKAKPDQAPPVVSLCKQEAQMTRTVGFGGVAERGSCMQLHLQATKSGREGKRAVLPRDVSNRFHHLQVGRSQHSQLVCPTLSTDPTDSHK